MRSRCFPAGRRKKVTRKVLRTHARPIHISTQAIRPLNFVAKYPRPFQSGVSTQNLRRLLPGDFRAFFAGLGRTYGDGLLAALNFSAFASLAGAERAALLSMHCAFHALTCSLAVFAS